MKFHQNWSGACIVDGKRGEFFPVTVPGNIQKDYACHMGWGDINYMNNCFKYKEIEDFYWIYKAKLHVEPKKGERVFFVTKGIEYEYDIILDGKTLIHHEGMFSPAELDITDSIKADSVLEVLIYPHPKRAGAPENRDQADQSCKPAVEYGWDWHPRTLVSGLWDETYIETRDEYFIGDVEVSYTLDEDLKNADVHFETDYDGEVEITITDEDGNLVCKTDKRDMLIENVKLWWCNGQGKAYLYNWRVKTETDEKRGRVGFKKVKLVMCENGWWKPLPFPKSRNDAPITVELNGRVIFAKGSNWVNPEIFTACIPPEEYREQVKLAKEANMNIFRCWGGAIIDKEPFFDACDENGIMVWQEFPLACNNYKGTEKYLKVLESEARAIVKRVRRHVCHILWCGGNELFNSWSKMTEQSHALRLLDKVCYEEDFEKPFIMTSPLNGMSHGGYFFYEFDTDRSVFEIYRNSDSTAYTEFGCPSMASYERIKEIFDEKTAENPVDEPDSPWVTHHGFRAWGKTSWCFFDVIEKYFGKQKSVADYVEKSQLLQCEGYKCIFEEARRQKPFCSMAINWDYNEPWKTVAGNNLLEYPSKPKPAYYAVKDALRPVMPSLRAEHFEYRPGEVLTAELWLLNDTNESVEDTIEVYFTVDGTKKHVLTWETGPSEIGRNLRGHKIMLDIPHAKTQLMTITLCGKHAESEYRLLLKNPVHDGEIFIPELNF